MAHEKVYGICENKCRVEVTPKEEVDELKNITSDEQEIGTIKIGDKVHRLYRKLIYIESIEANTSVRITGLANCESINAYGICDDTTLGEKLIIGRNVYVSTQNSYGYHGAVLQNANSHRVISINVIVEYYKPDETIN